jgi:hypothetical protein
MRACALVRAPHTQAQKRCLREFKKRLAGGSYACCADVLWDELFEGLWSVVDS